jgi:hypothetical protein
MKKQVKRKPATKVTAKVAPTVSLPDLIKSIDALRAYGVPVSAAQFEKAVREWTVS